MAATRAYIEGSGTQLQRAVTGSGTPADPDKFWVCLWDGAGDIVSPSNPLAVSASIDLTTTEALLTETRDRLPLLPAAPDTYTEAQLTAPGTTATRDARGRTLLTFYLSVAAIDTGIVVRPEGSADGTNWYPLGEDYTITANGGDAIVFAYPQPLADVRLNWVSESGGTAATLDVITVVGGRA